MAYVRWPWRWLEPEKGKYNWKIVDDCLRMGRERGQTVQMRFQPYTSRIEYATQPHLGKVHPPKRSVNVPDWYWDTGAKWLKQGAYAPHEPNSNDPLYIRHFGDFIRAFGERYDGHPDLESVDMAYAGFWGESGGNSTSATARKITEIYLRYFKKTHLLGMLGTPGATYAAKKTGGTDRPIGWRADCFGDLQKADVPEVPRHLTFNHTYDCYPRYIFELGMEELWKRRPVTMETCGTVASWYTRGYDLNMIIDQGYKYHMSVFMPKSVFFPGEFMDRLIEFDKKIGYRFVVRQMLLPLKSPAGKPVDIECFIDNVGCAPIYRDYRLALRFTQGRKQRIVKFKQDIRKWMPGIYWFKERIKVPADLKPGEAKLELAILDDKDVPKVFFAIKERKADRWHPLTSLDIVRTGS